ncbi:signal peptidase I [Paenibacillus sp. NPDC056579]|uniref:signal peptidase I n=1 Tax=unclassified Paenibacillus TaxID=185978 RepID=UPI001EF7B7E6|nr:signal peptidase I [Paenibacillus sp. H1-7]ULL14531.1 signal peptidase I [Paenibacillus sp. H1-7]
MKLFLALLVSLSSVYAQYNKPFIVEGPSMEPTYHAKDRLAVDTTYYQDHSFQRGDIVIVQVNENQYYLKRVIALPGETVKVEGDQVYVNGRPLKEPYIQKAVEEAASRGEAYNHRNMNERTVPEKTVFVLGDNRSNSLDSRDLGPIPFEKIVGKVKP